MLKDQYQRALVTGGAGFVGSHLVERLLERGLEVVSVDDYSAGKKENLAHLHERYQDKLNEVDCDITDYNKLRGCFEGVDVVFHQACSKMTICLLDPRRDLAVNAEGTFNLLDLSREFGVKKFVHASTGSVYGIAQYFPTDEKHSYGPTSYYGVSKLAGERYVNSFNHLYGLDTTILRYYHIYGPRQESSDVGGVVSIFARRAINNQDLTIFGDGSQVRSFTYVKDIVGINEFVATNPQASGQAYNCASGLQVTIQELADSVRDKLGKNNVGVTYEDWKVGDIKEFDVSHQKLTSLGFRFDYLNFNDGLEETLSWSKNYFQGQVDVPK